MNDGRQLLVTYRLARAKETLHEAEWNIENGFFNSAVNRIYYACYYAVTALLASREIDTKTHSGAKQMFGLHFVKTSKIDTESGRFYADLFNMRHKSDYDDFIHFELEDVADLILSAKLFVNSIEELLLPK